MVLIDSLFLLVQIIIAGLWVCVVLKGPLMKTTLRLSIAGLVFAALALLDLPLAPVSYFYLALAGFYLYVLIYCWLLKRQGWQMVDYY